MERILTGLAAAAAFAFLYQGLYILFQDPKAQKNRLFFYITLSAAAWNLAFAGLYSAGSPSAAAQWLTIARPFWVLIYALNVHFILRVTGQNRILRSPWFYILLHGSMVLLLFRAVQGFFLIQALRPAGPTWQPVYHLSRPWGILYLLYAAGCVLFPLILLTLYRRRALNREKRALAGGILISTAGGFALAAGSDLLIALLGLPMPPVGQLFLLVWLAGVWTVYRRHQLLGISGRAAADEILRQVPDYIILLSRKGLIEQINPSFQRALGLPPKSILGNGLDIFLFQTEAFRQALGKEEEKPGGTSFDAELLGSQGQVIPLSAEITQIGGKANLLPLGYSVVARDMRESQYLHRLEEEVRRRQESEEKLQTAKEMAESALLAKTRFLTAISHELKTPLNGIMGMLNLIQDSKSIGEIQQYTEKASLSAGNLLSLVDNILRQTRLDQGSDKPDFQEASLGELLDPLIETYQNQAETKGIRFQADLDPALPSTISTDPQFLKRILSHLLSNAVLYTQSGTITLAVRTADSHILFMVSDTGIGIPRDQLSRIYEPFYQVDGGTNRRYPGAGLGLTLSKELGEQLGGSLSVQSSPGEGSTFSLALPLR